MFLLNALFIRCDLYGTLYLSSKMLKSGPYFDSVRCGKYIIGL